MGNTCKGMGDDEELVIGTGIYDFKRGVRNIINRNKQIVPKDERNKKYYGKEKNFDRIQGKIKRTVSKYRTGVNEYRNGNVKVTIPVPN